MPPNAPPPFDPIQLFRQEEHPLERRAFDSADFRIDEPAADGSGVRHIVGHASMFNTQYELFEWDGWRYLEEVAPGAFRKTIKQHDVRALFNHDPNFILGRNTAGTLTLAEDDKGLAYDILAPETDTVRDLVIAPMRRGDVTQSSFGFEVTRQKIVDNKDERFTLRTIQEVKLWDVSPVTFPASPTTDSKVRAALAEDGLDLELMATAILRRRAGMTLERGDHDILRSAIDALQAHLTSTSEAEAAHHLDPAATPEAQAAHHLARAMSMRLRMLEISRPLAHMTTGGN